MIKVLIVDDQQLLVDLMKHLLSNNSEIQVIACANDGNQAVALAEKHQLDLILMDIMMPECNGIEATKRIKETNKKVKILVLTSSSNAEDVYDALDSGADGYVLKSISGDELILAIRSVHANMDVLHDGVREIANSSTSNVAYKIAQKTRLIVNDIEVELSERELSVIKMLVEGKTTSDMAVSLFISEGRLRNIITMILSKLMLKDRTQLAVFALKNKLI